MPLAKKSFKARSQTEATSTSNSIPNGEYPAVCIGISVYDKVETQDNTAFKTKKGDKRLQFNPIFAANINGEDRIITPFGTNAKFIDYGEMQGGGFTLFKLWGGYSTNTKANAAIQELLDGDDFEYGYFIGKPATLVYEPHTKKQDKQVLTILPATEEDVACVNLTPIKLPALVFNTKTSAGVVYKENVQVCLLDEWEDVNAEALQALEQ